MAVLKNKTRQPQVFNLDARFFVGNANETPVGKPCSLSFLSLERKEVDEAVLSCNAVKAALANGVLRNVTPKTAKTDEPPKKTAGKPTEAREKATSGRRGGKTG